MNDRFLEEIGFLCRWLLLGLAVAVMATVAWAGVLAAQEVAREAGTVMIVPDSLWPVRSSAHLRGRLVPPVRERSYGLAISSRADGPAMFATTNRGWIYPHIDWFHNGVNPITIKGMPYGALAYQRIEANLCVAEDSAEIFLADAQMVLSIDNLDALGGCMEQLSRRGMAVFFHAGPLGEFFRIRSRVKNLKITAPVTCEIMSQPDKKGALIRIARRLRRLKHGSMRKPIIITADVEFARWAGREGFFSYLIAPPNHDRPLSGIIFPLESFSKLQKHLAAQPVAE